MAIQKPDEEGLSAEASQLSDELSQTFGGSGPKQSLETPQDSDLSQQFQRRPAELDTASLKEEPQVMNVEAKRSPLRFVALALGIIVLTALIGGVAFAGYTFVSRTPESIIASMYTSMAEVQTIGYNANLTAMVATDDSTHTIAVQNDGYGHVNTQQGLKPKGDTTLDLTVDGVTANISLLYEDTERYVRLNQIAGGTEADMLRLFFGEKWINIGDASLSDVFADAPFTADVEHFLYSPQMHQDIFSALQRSNIFEANMTFQDRILPGETPGYDEGGANARAYHITFSVNKDRLEQFLLSLAGTSVDGLRNEQVLDAIRDIDSITGDLWVGADDSLLRRFDLVMSSSSGLLRQFTLQMMFSDYNGLFFVTAPDDAVPFSTIFNGKLPTQPSPISPLPPTVPVDRDSDNDGLLDWEEAYYGTDPFNPDTDGDGFLDGEEVMGGYDPLGPGLLDPSFVYPPPTNGTSGTNSGSSGTGSTSTSPDPDNTSSNSDDNPPLSGGEQLDPSLPYPY
jgi:hypothetical protein